MECWVEEAMEEVEEEFPKSYERFESNGKMYVKLIDSGVRETDENWADADEILESSNYINPGLYDQRKFRSVLNMLCNVRIIPAFQDTSPFEVDVRKYDGERLNQACEYVTGKSPLIDEIEKDDLLEELKD